MLADSYLGNFFFIFLNYIQILFQNYYTTDTIYVRIGGESLAVAQNTYAVSWFFGKELNLVFGLQLSIARLVRDKFHSFKF
jgi:hypothetical protein